MSADDFKELLNRYLNDTLTTEELHRLLAQLQQHEHTEMLKQAIEQALRDHSFKELPDKSRSDIIFQKIIEKAENGPPRKNRFTWWKYAAAAALIITLTVTLLPKNPPGKPNVPATTVTDVAPGTNKAILQLANGSTISLDDSANGLLAQQGATKIEKLRNGQLTYHAANQKENAVLYNTITTPRGGQYHIILPDGSKVWLNAASSLRFPTAFTGDERIVQLTGEVYFEVAKDAKPFRVHVNEKATIEVLGTHFNVNAYENEQSLHTTLLEGSVKVTTTHSVIIKPGEQALASPKQPITIQNADLEQVMAWKNGLFQFNSENIQTIMRQIERWYDVDVYYKGPIPDGHYSGIVPRANNLRKVLRILEESDLKFTLEGRKLVVL